MDAPDFSIKKFKSIVMSAYDHDYDIMTVKQYLSRGCPGKNALVLRHDVDTKPHRLKAIVDAELEMGVRSTIYVRVTANEYNVFAYTMMPYLIDLERRGFEIGLHSNFLEYAQLQQGIAPMSVLKFEVECLRSFLTIDGIAPHRDFNYVYNALPWLRTNWDAVKRATGLTYEAYDDRIMSNTLYVNECFEPHLLWKNRPEHAFMNDNKSVYLSMHPHWWYTHHPFED